jgi:hypothetical protein
VGRVGGCILGGQTGNFPVCVPMMRLGRGSRHEWMVGRDISWLHVISLFVVERELPAGADL